MAEKNYRAKIVESFTSLYGRSMALSFSVIVFVGFAVSLAVFLSFYTATPDTITMISGPAGSSFQKNAEKYKKILAHEGIKLTIISSDGSVDNLKKLADPKVKVDIGFVEGGELGNINIENLVSLGSIAYQPLMIFYHGKPRTLLSEFRGQRLNIGQEGSGTHAMALTLLKANGIEPGGDTIFVNTPSGESVQALLEHRIDGMFVMGDSVSSDVIRQLLHTPGITLFNVTQADGYTRRIHYLNKLEMPRGTIDFGKDIPAEDLSLVGPTVELIARKSLHPALIDVLLEAAREVHGSAGMFRHRGEFPAPLEHEIRISPDATRYYATGKSFLYRTFPFWLASLINRVVAVIVPIALLLIPGLKLAPVIYRWRIQSRIYPWYKTLLELERDAFKPSADKQAIEALLHKLDHIETTVNRIKIPAAYGDMFYGLRGHIRFVRDRLVSMQSGAQPRSDA